MSEQVSSNGTDLRPAVPDADEQQLMALSIGHYVFAGTIMLFWGGMLLQLYYVNSILKQAQMSSELQLQQDQLLDTVHVVLAVYFALFLLHAIGLIFAGISLKRCRHRTFCLILAGLNCFLFPIGTVLGGFTLVVLFRPSVIQRFASKVR